MNIRINSRSLKSLAALTITAAALTGCASQIDQVRADPTPGLDSISRSSDRILNDHALTFDHNKRMLVDDFYRILLFDRPSKLTPVPMSR